MNAFPEDRLAYSLLAYSLLLGFGKVGAKPNPVSGRVGWTAPFWGPWGKDVWDPVGLLLPDDRHRIEEKRKRTLGTFKNIMKTSPFSGKP